MKRLIRKISAFFVTAYANHVYRDRVKIADKLHKKHGARMFVCMPFWDNNLIVMDRKGFRHAKRLRKIYDPRVSTMNLMDGSYYYTADRGGNNPIPEREKELRRLAFIHQMLRRANLLKT